MEQLAASATAQGSYFMQKAGGGEGRGGEKGGGGGGGKATLWQSAKRATQIIAYARHCRAKAAFNPLRAAACCPRRGGGLGARLDTYLLLPLVTLQRPGWLSTVGLIPAHANVPEKS